MIRGFLDAGGVRGVGVRAWKNFGNLLCETLRVFVWEVSEICLLTYLEKTADNADAPSARSSSLFCLRQNLLRSRFGDADV